MLSIIISSYQPHYYIALEKNIADTIGIPYEIIKIDNPRIMGICEAYNRGAEKAQYDFLLFLHEDVLFETQDWGKELIELLNLENCGAIGVAGTDYYGYVPYQWANRRSKIKKRIRQSSTKTSTLSYSAIYPQYYYSISMQEVDKSDANVDKILKPTK